jgi:RNA polymerase sigma-B factor
MSTSQESVAGTVVDRSSVLEREPERSAETRSFPRSDHAEETIRALMALAADDPRRPVARQQAIEAWVPMAHRLARRFTGRGEHDDDLRQVAVVGLIKAVDGYDDERGDFAAYAIPTVVGEVKRHFRDRTWSIRVPRRLQEMRIAINNANRTLSHTLGRSPTVADIAAHLGVTEEDVLEGLEGAQAYHAVSLSTPVGTDSTELGDTFGGDDHGFALAEARVDLGPALQALDPRERRILVLRFYGNMSQTQIAEQVGVSQMHVSRLITRALAKLRSRMAPA